MPKNAYSPPANEADTKWLREQLELLSDEVRFGSLSTTPEQMGRLLSNIAKGYDWREGAWK